MKEKWKPIVFHERYFISDLGRIWDSKSKRVMRPTVTSEGYLGIQLYFFGQKKRKYKKVHIAVAEAFLGEKPEGYQVHHINHNKLDSRLTNLRYVTGLENIEAYRKYLVTRRKVTVGSNVTQMQQCFSGYPIL